MCNNCIHAAVCGKCKATGGQVGKCEHHAQERKGQWSRDGNWNTCSECGFFYLSSRPLYNHCPSCGAEMKAE